ncbi:hypothetical protein N9933_03090 [bacterium]|nr:hypothetical protein [bacterium]
MTLTQFFRMSFLICWFGIASLGNSPLFAQSTEDADSCALSQQNLRYYFMEYKEGTYLNLKYLENLYYSCEEANLRSTIVYYYLKSIHLLNVKDNYVDKPSDLFNYFYRRFQVNADRISEIGYMDPAFSNLLETRRLDLEQSVLKAETYGDQPTFSGNPNQQTDYNSGASLPSAEINPSVPGSVYDRNNNARSNYRFDEPVPADGISRGPETESEWVRKTVKPEKPSRELDFPNMPLPPPGPSSIEVFPSRSFSSVTTLADMNEILSNALNKNGYYGKHYFSVPDGFALVTQMEKIYPDGESYDTWDRWETAVNLKNTFSLRDYFISLVFARPGYYRAITFVVAPDLVNRNPLIAGGRLNEASWRNGVGPQLPAFVGEIPFTYKYTVTARVYELEVPENGEARLIEGREALQARVHLQKAGIWDKLVKE